MSCASSLPDRPHDVITERSHAAAPEAPGREVVHAVPDPDGVVPDLDAGEDHREVHHRLADRRGRVDAVLHGHELDLVLLQISVERAEVHHVGADAVDAVDHDAVDQACAYILAQSVHGWAVDVAPDIAVVLVWRDSGHIIEDAVDVLLAGRQLHLDAVRRVGEV